MSRILHSSARLDALDVSHDQCPPLETLPSNITLKTHDCLSEPTESMTGAYDIIHIQNFNSVVRNNDPNPVIDNALKMLSKDPL